MADTPALDSTDRDNLVAYLDGELDAQSALTLEAKLQRDPRARAEAEQLKKTWEMLDFLPRPAVPASFTQQTLERITRLDGKAPRKSSPLLAWWTAGGWGWRVAWAAGIIVACLAGFAMGRNIPRRGQALAAASPDINAEVLVREQRLLENRRLYERVESVDFIKELANPNDPDLFGDEAGS